MMQLSAKHPTMEMRNPVQRIGGGGIEQIPADWNQTDETAVDYIKNKPDIDGINTAISTINGILDHKPDTEELATVAFSGDYDDLTNCPIGVSYFNNDAGYLTAHQDISGKADKTARIAKTASDTTASIDPNKLYVFPTMTALTISLNAGDSSVVNEYHFIFTSGTTATNLTLPATVKQPYGFTVEANTTYEVSIMENCMVVQRWEA